ncbi:PKD domain-containing protein [Arcicella sp. LKC2W]|uniref:PKD domain-containing protein n=1 Tax=Arcicella sp. LKC2W TaxID=2984198 RepID=UPI002B1F06CE|nr:PKD domain-containing protein [Arcicella sp. LKC2W]MEA5461070.1 PKD domain-containing protein [Arcicella sp. LKC2W]
MKIKINVPNSPCTISKYKIIWDDGKEDTYPFDLTKTEHEHEYDFKDFVNGCSERIRKQVEILTDNKNCESNITPVNFYNTPNPNFTANRQFPCVGQEVIFSPQACPSTNNVQYTWDYGDGTATDNRGRYTYPKIGTYSVKLTVKTDCGTESIEKSITIIDQAKAAVKDSGFVAIKADTSIYCLTNGKGIIRLDGTVSTNATEYDWIISPAGSVTFLDKTNRNSPRPKLQFNGTGNYSIELTVKNDCGIPSKIKCFHTAEELPNISITHQNDVCETLSYKIPNFINGVTYTLNGNPITQNQIISIPVSNQINRVEAKVTGYCGTQVAKDSFYVSPPTIAKITSARDTSLCVGSSPLLLTTNITTGSWTGAFIENQKQFRPTTVGIYWLKYTNGSGKCATSDSVRITVKGVNIDAQSLSICKTDVYVLLKGTPSTGIWSAVNCTTCNIKKDTLFLTNVVNSSISLNYEVFENGCKAQKNVTVSIGNPKAGFTITGGCTGTPISVSNTSTGANSFQWFINGTPESTNNTPNLNNLPSGPTTLLLEAIMGTCKDSFSQVISLTAPPTTSNFNTNISEGCSPLKVDFIPEGKVRLDVNYTWEFGNGTNSKLFQPPTQTFINQNTQSKILKIIFTAENICGKKSSEKEITIRPVPNAEIGVDSTIARCSPARIRFSNRSKGAEKGGIWSWGDGKSETSMADTLSHLFSARDSIRTYWVKLEVSNSCKKEVDSITVKVYPSTVVPLFQISKSIVCTSDTIIFKDSTKPIPERVLWDFGDGSSPSQERSPKHLFNQPDKTYIVKLIAYTQCGYDSVQRIIQTRSVPTGDFSFNNFVCENQSVNFKNLSNSNLYSSIWDFGDNSPLDSANVSPSHTFKNIGNQSIKLTLKDFRTGCKITLPSKLLNVKQGPKALFSIVGDSAQCTPATIRFNNLSKNADDYLWRFSDGKNSANESPELNFGLGQYSVSLLATLNGVCKDSILVDNAFKVDSCHVFFPEAFSPNNDGIGDKYTIFGKGIKRIISLKIRNRWGELVFENTDFQPNNSALGWDGEFNKQPAPEGIYISEVEVEFKGKKPEKLPSGCIYLVR